MTWVRFAWLKEQGIVDSWAQVKNLQANYGFPAGRMLSPASRAWNLQTEIMPWLASRPVEGPEPRGAAKARRGRPRKAASQTEAVTP